MSIENAKLFKKNVTPTRSRNNFKRLQNEILTKKRLADPDKGIESICRPVCEQNLFGWKEKWDLPFIEPNEAINLQSEHGMERLEQYLSTKVQKTSLDNTIEDISAKERSPYYQCHR